MRSIRTRYNFLKLKSLLALKNLPVIGVCTGTHTSGSAGSEEALVQVLCEDPGPRRLLLPAIDARQTSRLLAVLKPIQHGGDDYLTLAAHAVIRVQVLQGGLGKDAVAGPNQDDLGRAGGPAHFDHFSHRLQEELGVLHRLVIDVSPFDNSGTKKEGVALTYKKLDAYAPNFAYLGNEGYLIHGELRPGNQHCQDGTPEFLDRAIELARHVTPGKLLVRMDAGNDDAENLRRLRKKKRVDWIIRRNLRRESEADWLEEAQCHGEWETPREGKEVYTGETWRERDGKLQRVVFEVIQRTITADGQRLLVPDVEIATWWTSLRLSPKKVIELYHQHGTSEQFHSELKGDLDLERLPSGKFATNALMLSLGLVAYNLLRLCGQTALAANDALPPRSKMPLSRPVFRRRLRSVIQDLMYFAARLTKHSHRWGLSLWRSNPWRSVWENVYERFLRPPTPATG